MVYEGPRMDEKKVQEQRSLRIIAYAIIGIIISLLFYFLYSTSVELTRKLESLETTIIQHHLLTQERISICESACKQGVLNQSDTYLNLKETIKNLTRANHQLEIRIKEYQKVLSEKTKEMESLKANTAIIQYLSLIHI
eukprot:TRINITY_DN7908_c0_g1_i1.p1 TRINITY_DN7908_c0_g1~~TRINITY_DN7908_c0_g1_i1.p1  ORF type:complete len:139 (-),score=6.14 TRINITY_DN7908_c0_g1_i1:61-477(-)